MQEYRDLSCLKGLKLYLLRKYISWILICKVNQVERKTTLKTGDTVLSMNMRTFVELSDMNKLPRKFHD